MSTDIDPRIKIELERLNSATETINQYEIKVDEARKEFNRLLKESVEKIKQSGSKIGNAIQTAKPYYEARLYCTQVAKEVQQAQQNYDKARSTLAAAKEMVYLAEQGLGEKPTLDIACQELLSHAISRVNECQQDCMDAKNFLKMYELKQDVANTRVAKLQSQLKGAIRASRPYYETRANCNGLLKAQKQKIEEMESKILDAKMNYNEALRNLETISEEIHKLRQLTGAKLEEFDLQDEKQHNCQSQQSITTTPQSNFDQLESTITTADEYLHEFSSLNLNLASPSITPTSTNAKQKLFKEFNLGASGSKFGCELKTEDSDGDNAISPNQTDMTNLSSDDIDHWTEIRLSNSNSTSTDNSTPNDELHTPTSVSDSSSENLDVAKKKVVTRVIRYDDDDDPKEKRKESLSTWLTRSSFKAEAGRRQSFDLLLDNTKEIFQGLTKSLERRNSESEVSVPSDFFSFGKQALTDEQVENLQLDEDHTNLGLALSSSKNSFNISKERSQ